jgi:hypothetical protein
MIAPDDFSVGSNTHYSRTRDLKITVALPKEKLT